MKKNININKLNEDALEISIGADTPIYVIDELVKSLISKGMREDLSKSTVSSRIFYRETEHVADRLIKSLESLVKQENEDWTTKIPVTNQEKLRWKRWYNEQQKQKKNQTNVNRLPKPAPNQMPAPASSENDMWPHGESWKKSLDSVNKSNYGPKGAGQYTAADNVKRKEGNVGDVAGVGPNKNVKSFSSKPGQLSAKQSADQEAKKYKKLNRKQPVKTFSPEEIAAINAQRNKLASSLDPNLNYEETLSKHESEAIDRLTNLMTKKNMLKKLQPSNDDFIAAGENMGLGSSQEQLDKTDAAWGNTINNWLQEASKPISSRFESKQQEIEYWNSIKIDHGSEGDAGY